MLQKLANKARAQIRKMRGDWREHPTADVFACCPLEDEIVWRIAIETCVPGQDPIIQEADIDSLELEWFDRAHAPLEVESILFENQLIQYDDCAKWRLTYSVRMSMQVESFTLVVHHKERTGKLSVGFEQWRTFVREARHLRRDAWYQPDYDRWLAAHRESNAHDDSAHLPESHVAVMSENVQLAPGAIERISRLLEDTPDILAVYTDSDAIDRFGRRVMPLFKPEFSPEYLQAVDYIGGFIVVRRDVFKSTREYAMVSGSDEPSPYDHALMAARFADVRGGDVLHVPEVLFHETDPVLVSKRFVEHPAESQVVPAVLGNPTVDIIIPNKDHKDVLERCIDSLLTKATYDAFRILIVENNSEDLATFEYYEQLMRDDDRIKVICAETSGEFNYSRLINLGVAQSESPYVLLLNNDTEVIEPNFIQYLLSPFKNEHVGVVGAKLFFKDGLVQHVGMLIGPDGTVVHVNQDKEDQWPGYMGRSIYPTNVSAVTGACQMVRRDVFNEVGGYSERFAVGYNDADFCCKVVRAGKRIVMQPAAKLYHYEFTSRGREENDPAKLERWRAERALFKRSWPRYFEEGDPYANPNLDKNSRYFSLPE